MRSFSLLSLFLASSCLVEPDELATVTSAVTPHQPVVEKELFITDISVVDDARLTRYVSDKVNTDPEGGWSIGRLFRNMLHESERDSSVSERNASRFAMNWLRTWEQDQTVNGRLVPGRPSIRSLVINPWRVASGCAASVPDASCKLDFRRAPFRLLAVAFRPDLRKAPVDATPTQPARPGQSGEGRLIFGVLGAQGEALPFTVIFEYGIHVSAGSCSQIFSEAEKWHELGLMAFGSSYNDKLFDRTREFTRVDGATNRPNNSALNQIRTNEVALGSPWEMREFVIDPVTRQLRLEPVKQEPDVSYNNTVALRDWARQNRAAILAGTHVVPAAWLAGSSPTVTRYKWNFEPDPTMTEAEHEALRKSFAINTCNGCHRNETGAAFVHVTTRQAGAASQLSAFLTSELAVNGPRVTDFKALLASGSACVPPPVLGHGD